MIAHDPNLEIRLARDEADVLSAQRLRYRVFVEELGGDGPLVDHDARLERDRFDPHFDHLVLIDRRRAPETLEHVVGVYRLLGEKAAANVGKFYSEDEYDLTPLRTSGHRLLELGRSCLAPEYRGGTALFMLWNGLAEYVLHHQVELLFGVASFHGTDTTVHATALSYLHHFHRAPPEICPRARSPIFQPVDLQHKEDIDRRKALRAMPSLVKAYLRIGGQVGDGAFVDHAFNTTDICLILDTNRLTTRQRQLYSSGGH